MNKKRNLFLAGLLFVTCCFTVFTLSTAQAAAGRSAHAAASRSTRSATSLGARAAAGARGGTVECYFTIYAKQDATKYEIEVGEGWNAGSYKIASDDIVSTEALNNGIKKYVVAFGLDTDDMPIGTPQRVSLVKPGGFFGGTPVSDAVKAAPKATTGADARFEVTLKERIEKSYPVRFVDTTGAAVEGTPKALELLISDSAGNDVVRTVKKSASAPGTPATPGYELSAPMEYNEKGDFLGSDIVLSQNNINKSVTMNQAGTNVPYTIHAAELKQGSITVTLKKVQLTNKVFHVVLERTFDMLDLDADWKFSVTGAVKQQLTHRITAPFSKGDISFDVTANNVDEKAQLRLGALPKEYMYYGISKQTFDEKTNTLRVTLSKKVYMLISPMEQVTYMQFGEKHAKHGFSLALYDAQGKLVEKSREEINAYGLPTNCFTKIVPGEYSIKILDAPEQYKQSLDLQKEYRLRMLTNGVVQIKIATSQSNGEEVWANPGGGTDTTRFNNSKESIALTGYKYLFNLLVPRKATITKVAVDPTTNKETQQLVAKVGDTVEFKLKGSTPVDYRIIAKYQSSSTTYADIGVAQTIRVSDVLDERFEFVPNSFVITRDGAPATDVVANYDTATRTISLEDATPYGVSEFDFNKAIAFRGESRYEVSFKVKIKALGTTEKPLVNTIPGSTVEIVPKTSISLSKQWVGGASLLKDLDVPAFLQNLSLVTWQGSVKLKTQPLSELVKPGDIKVDEHKNFSLKLEGLDLYTVEELAKPQDKRVALRYEIVETMPQTLAEHFAGTVTSDEVKADGVRHISLQNTYLGKLVNLQVTKQWELPAGKTADEYTPVFKLIMKNTATQQEKVFTFTRNSNRLVDEAGAVLSFKYAALVSGQLMQRDIAPVVSVANDVYSIKNLPATDPDSNAYSYEIQEVDVLRNDVSVKGAFTITGNDDPLKAADDGVTLVKTIKNVEKPVVSPKPPVPKTGDYSMVVAPAIFSVAAVVLAAWGVSKAFKKQVR